MANELGDLVGSIDQGSGSSRFTVFSSKTGKPIASHQIESTILAPNPRWVEMDAKWLLTSVEQSTEETVKKLRGQGIDSKRIKYELGDLVGSIDQGSGSSRFTVFSSKTGKPIASHQIESTILAPNPRWVEMDATWLLTSVEQYIEETVQNLENPIMPHIMTSGIGITNQMVTTIFWDRLTGEPLYNALFYSDTRAHEIFDSFKDRFSTKQLDELQRNHGMPFSSIFLPFKIPWMFKNVEGIKESFQKGRLLSGTVNTWILWNITGGCDGGQYLTDITNAGHTGLLHLFDRTWDAELCSLCNVPMSILPEIRSTSEIFGYMCHGSLKGVPISGMLGDQLSATVGQLCFNPGQSKCTYGTVASLNINIGTKAMVSELGLLSCPLYQFGDGSPATYTLEAVVESCGCIVKWLRDNMGFIKTSAEIETLAQSVEDTNDCYFVTALEGFFFPYWVDNARGTICGLNRETTKEHICRAVLEAVCFQIKKGLDIATEESGFPIPSLKVDGGMIVNNLFMQIQADLIGKDIERPSMKETASFGAALMAGAAEGIDLFRVSDDRMAIDVEFSEQTLDIFTPKTTQEDRDKRMKRWEKAVEKSFHWTQD